MNKLSFFLPCCNRIIPLLTFAGIFSLYFSPKSKDLRLQIWNVPLWNTPVTSHTRTLLHGLHLLGFAYWFWHMDLKHGFDHGLKEIFADEGQMAESFGWISCPFPYPAVMNKSFINLRRDILVIFLAKARRFALANLERCTLEHSSYFTHTDFTTWTSPPRIWLSDLTHRFETLIRPRT